MLNARRQLGKNQSLQAKELRGGERKVSAAEQSRTREFQRIPLRADFTGIALAAGALPLHNGKGFKGLTRAIILGSFSYTSAAMPKATAKDDHSSRRDHVVVIPEENLTVNLRDRWLAAFLAWLIPGLGHLYQRRTAKGILFMACILGTFLYGLFALGGGKVVYASAPGQTPYRWQYWCQLGAGLPALPALVQRERFKQDKPALWSAADPPLQRLMAPPRSAEQYVDPDTGRTEYQPFTSPDQQGNTVVHPDELAKWNHDLHHFFELGTVYTMIAGLLNVLVIYDAAAGPLVILPEPKKRRLQEGGMKDQRKRDEGVDEGVAE